MSFLELMAKWIWLKEGLDSPNQHVEHFLKADVSGIDSHS